MIIVKAHIPIYCAHYQHQILNRWKRMARIISAGKQLPSLKKKWAIPTSMCIHSPEARKRIVSCAISNKPNLSDSAELVDTEASGKVFLLHM